MDSKPSGSGCSSGSSGRKPVPTFDAEFKQRMYYVKDTISPTCSHLEKAFNELLAGQNITLRRTHYKRILKDFGVTDDHLRQYNMHGFVEVLKYYVGCWPGWKDKQSTFKTLNIVPNLSKEDDDIVYEGLGQETYKNWFKEFYAYVYLKIQDFLEMDSLFDGTTSDKSKDSKDAQTQTERVVKLSTADYRIVIEGPPRCLNTIAFTSIGDDIVIKQHVDTPWDGYKLTLKQFLNCPYVKVNLEIADISFSRSNVHDFERYISKVNAPVALTTNDHITSTSKMDTELPCTAYNYHFFQKYFEQFLRMLEAEKSLILGRKAEIAIIIKEFLADINEININDKVMATNVSICFLIGNTKYIRSKQMAQKGIHYLEIITPKVAVSLKHFRAEQDTEDNERISFKSLNDLENSPDRFIQLINSGCISYSCNLCNKVFSSYLNIGQHFNQEHRREQDVICSKCKGIVDMNTLAGSRWVHDCKKKKIITKPNINKA